MIYVFIIKNSLMLCLLDCVGTVITLTGTSHAVSLTMQKQYFSDMTVAKPNCRMYIVARYTLFRITAEGI